MDQASSSLQSWHVLAQIVMPRAHDGQARSPWPQWATSIKTPRQYCEFPDNSLNWVRSRRSLLKHALGVGHALVLSHGAAPRPTRPGMIHSMSIAKPPVRIRHGNGRVWKYWWPMWPLSPTGFVVAKYAILGLCFYSGTPEFREFFSCFTST